MPVFIKAQSADPFLQLTPRAVEYTLLKHFKPAPGYVAISSFSTAILVYKKGGTTIHRALGFGRQMAKLHLEVATHQDIREASRFITKITGHACDDLQEDVYLNFTYQLFMHKEDLRAYWDCNSNAAQLQLADGSLSPVLQPAQGSPRNKLLPMASPSGTPPPFNPKRHPESPTPSGPRRKSCRSVPGPPFKHHPVVNINVSTQSSKVATPRIPTQSSRHRPTTALTNRKKLGNRAAASFKGTLRKSMRKVMEGLSMKGRSTGGRSLRLGNCSVDARK